MAYDISLICCYTNVQQLEDLKESLRGQQVSVELIALDNRSSRWESAAAAYNYGVTVASTPVLLFAHQDIVFVDTTFLKDFLRIVLQDHELVVGVAGAVLTKDGTGRDLLSAMYQGSKECKHATIAEPTSVTTLDECLFGCHRDTLKKIGFDERTCDGWHFYAVDFCLQAHNAGMEVKVIPAEVIHSSGGNRDESYYVAQEKIKVKYRNCFEVIPTTCGWTRTADIDPFRPIVEDELTALRNHGIAYDLNFFHEVNFSLSLTSEDFFPSFFSVRSAETITNIDSDEDFFRVVKNGDVDEGLFDFAVQLNNMLKGRRWLLRDLLALHGESVQAVKDEYELSRSYRLGRRLLPWAGVDSENIAGSADVPHANVLEGSSDVTSASDVWGLLDRVLLYDPLCLPETLHWLGDHFTYKKVSDQTATDAFLLKVLDTLFFGSRSDLEEIATMQRDWNDIKLRTAALRDAYERSVAYRFGRFVANMRARISGNAG